MRITRQDRDERKERLLYVAYELFCEKGIDAVTLAHIAQAASVGLSSIYRYYDSKATLVMRTQTLLWAETVEDILDSARDDLKGAHNGWQELEQLLGHFKLFFKQRPRYLLFSTDFKLYLVRNGIKLSQASYEDMMRPVSSVFLAALRRGQADGSVNPNTSPEDQYLALWGVLRGYGEKIILYDEMYEGPNPWRAQFDRVLGVMLDALRRREQPSERPTGG